MLGIDYVQFFVNGIIEFGGICSGTQVENKRYFRIVLFQPTEKIFAVYFMNEFLPFQVWNLIHPGKFIHDHQVIESKFIQVTRHHAPDESGGPGNYDGFIFVHYTAVNADSADSPARNCSMAVS